MKFFEFISNNFNMSLSSCDICYMYSKVLLPFYGIFVKSNCFYRFETYAVVFSCFLVLKALAMNIKLSLALRLLNPISIKGFYDTYNIVTYRDNILDKNFFS